MLGELDEGILEYEKGTLLQEGIKENVTHGIYNHRKI